MAHAIEILQFLTWPLVFVVSHIFFKIDIRGKENLNKISSPVLFVSNHIAFYDSFLFRLVLGFNTPLLPLYFMAVNKFHSKILNVLWSIGVIPALYKIFGAFIIIAGQGIEKGISKARDIIRAGGNVVMYPEGMMIKSGVVGSFKRGAAVLASQTGVRVIPLSFRLGARRLIRRKLTVSVGAPLTIDPRASAETITNLFRDIVVGLRNKY